MSQPLKSKILVTGGAGFIGSHLVDVLVKAGHSVEVIDDLSTGNSGQLNPEAVLHRVDILSDAVDQIFASGGFDTVYHLAAQTDVMTSVSEPAADARTNILGGIGILEHCRRHQVRKVVYSSSSSVFGEPDYLPMDEAHPIRPQCPYAASKHTLEHYLEIYRLLHGLEFTVLRYANAYGPRQDPHHEGGVTAIFAYKLLQGQSPIVYGDGEQTRDFVHVADLVAANLACLKAGDGGFFNLGTGIETSVNHLYAELVRGCGVDLAPEYRPERKGEMRRLSLTSAKAMDELGWSPRVDLAAGLHSVIEFFRENGHG
jgi:UDP-glucose 4-epimerase